MAEIVIYETIRKGNTGPLVETLQVNLRELGYDPGPIDGIFGDLTEAAVRRLQADKGLTVDGIVGPNTWRALYVPVTPPVTVPPTPPPTPIPLIPQKWFIPLVIGAFVLAYILVKAPKD